MYIFKYFLSALILFPLICFSSESTSKQAIEFMEKYEISNAGWEYYIGNAKMELTSGSDTLQREYIINMRETIPGKRGNESIIKFIKPLDSKGTALLSKNNLDNSDDQWIYLPSAKRIKRIISSNRSGSFLGSEFSYEDLTPFENKRYNFTAIATNKCKNIPDDMCTFVDATPIYQGASYKKLVISIDTKMRMRSIEYYAQNNSISKELTFDNYVELKKNIWRATQLTMLNSQTNNHTKITFDEQKILESQPDSMFNEQQFFND